MSCDATSSRARPVLLLCLGLLLGACSRRGQDYEIQRTRSTQGKLDLDKTRQDRFGNTGRSASPHGAGARPGAQQSSGMRVVEMIEWQVPEGFEQMPAREFRDINLRSGQVELYMTQIAAGGAKANLDRWRGQMGLPGLSSQELAEARNSTLLQVPAYRLDLRGDYRGMGAKKLEGARMLGMYAQFPKFAISIKMIGPGVEVDQKAGAFEAFCKSMVWNAEMRKALQEGKKDDPHATGHAPRIDKDKIHWQTPDGWEEQGARTMRLVTFKLSDGAECYVSEFPGDVGGLRANLDRWIRAAGNRPAGQKDIDGLTEVDFLGRKGQLLESIGSEKGVLVMFFLEPQQSIFVRLNGTAAAVRKHKDAFLAFCKGLEVKP